MATVGEICSGEAIASPCDTTVARAASLMRDHNVGSLIVAESRDGTLHPVGIVTDRDIVVEIVAMHIDSRDVKVEEVMGSSLVVARENVGIRETLEVLRHKGVRRLPVLSMRGNLLGIVAANDLMRPSPSRSTRSDHGNRALRKAPTTNCAGYCRNDGPNTRPPSKQVLIVGGLDDVVIGLNQGAAARLRCEHRIAIVPGATHLFEEAGKLDVIARLARDWFQRQLRGPAEPTQAAGASAAT
jgi:CBS domain-containing protein